MTFVARLLAYITLLLSQRGSLKLGHCHRYDEGTGKQKSLAKLFSGHSEEDLLLRPSKNRREKLNNRNKVLHQPYPIYPIYTITNGTGLYILPLPAGSIHINDAKWAAIPMPDQSFYAGFKRPTNHRKWKIAQLQAARGEQILLSRILQTIRSPMDLIHNDINFKWVHRLADYHFSKKDYQNGLKKLLNHNDTIAPIIMLGYKTFDRDHFEGKKTAFKDFSPAEIIALGEKFRIPRKIVAIGMMDRNWGYLSTQFLNRTGEWGVGFEIDGQRNPHGTGFKYPVDQIRSFLDDPNLVMLLVNQHHNCSHPKVLSLPLGIRGDPKAYWRDTRRMIHQERSLKKDYLLLSATSNYSFRPNIIRCVAHKMGSDFTVYNKLSTKQYREKILQSRFVLAMPGIGYDTYRLWETLYSGSIAVVERGMGMDRTFYKLPVLLVDDFAVLTADLLRQAYVEALYRADDWEFHRLTKQYWEELIYAVSDSASIEPMLQRHPMLAEEANFTRPLVPFTCQAFGGCGAGTKRIPVNSCAIDASLVD